jgi:hypothetical protein|uniref:hypothetical protein n=1 Tax=Segatella hominis TaxID=2518605 RepID=UPI0040258AB7
MGIFNIFNRRSDNGAKLSVSLPVIEPTEAKEEIKSVETPVVAPTNKEKPMTISYATGWPIDVVYGYLHKNYEDKGFQDAMLKSDLAFKDINMRLIRNKILMVFREINLNYDVMKQDLQVRIDNCNAAGLLTTVAQLEKNMQLIDVHKKELADLEADFRNNANEASIPLQSYECGFLRGIATVSLGGGQSQIMPQMLRTDNSVVKQSIA